MQPEGPYTKVGLETGKPKVESKKKNTVSGQISTAVFKYSVFIFSLISVTCRQRKMKEQGEVDLNFSHFNKCGMKHRVQRKKEQKPRKQGKAN